MDHPSPATTATVMQPFHVDMPEESLADLRHRAGWLSDHLSGHDPGWFHAVPGEIFAAPRSWVEQGYLLSQSR
jgi:hypothetical protein